MPKAEVAMVILHPLADKQFAVLFRELKRGAVGLGGVVGSLALPENLEPGLLPLWRFAVWATVDFHLQNAQVEPHLNFVAAVVTLDDAHREILWVVAPAVQD